LSGTTGVKVKVAEAMAFGRPLVTTSVGIDPGQRDQLDPGTLVADTEQDFATSVLDLLTQPNVRIEKGRGAKRVYESWFSQEACYREVARWIDAVAKPAA
jgi:glycosyltransferase involved in cell wall biosynthesis